MGQVSGKQGSQSSTFKFKEFATLTVQDIQLVHGRLIRQSNKKWQDCMDADTLARHLPWSEKMCLGVSHAAVCLPTSSVHAADWRACFGALALLSHSDIGEVVPFLLTLYEGDRRKKLKRETAEKFCLALFSCYQRLLLIYQDDKGPRGVFNVEQLTSELMGRMFKAKTKGVLPYMEARDCLEEYAPLVASQLPHNQSKGNLTSTIINCYHSSPVPPPLDGTSSSPVARHKHAAAYSRGALYILGGCSAYRTLRDAWTLDIETEEWTQLKPEGEAIPMLQDHAMVAYRDHLYIFGGEFGSGMHDEAPLWIYCLVENQLIRHTINGEVMKPDNRRSHSLVVSQGALHMYGGYFDLQGSTSELWTFDIASESWHLAHSDKLAFYMANRDRVIEESPGARHGHCAAVVGHTMWVYGGMCDLSPRNDVWIWKFGVRRWSRVKLKQQLPHLTGHSCCVVGSDVLIVGGEKQGQLQPDIWRINTERLTICKVELSGTPPGPRAQHASVLCLTPLPTPQSSPCPKRGHRSPDKRDTSSKRPVGSPAVSSPALSQQSSANSDSRPLIRGSLAASPPRVRRKRRQRLARKSSSGRGSGRGSDRKPHEARRTDSGKKLTNLCGCFSPRAVKYDTLPLCGDDDSDFASTEEEEEEDTEDEHTLVCASADNQRPVASTNDRCGQTPIYLGRGSIQYSVERSNSNETLNLMDLNTVVTYDPHRDFMSTLTVSPRQGSLTPVEVIELESFPSETDSGLGTDRNPSFRQMRTTFFRREVEEERGTPGQVGERPMPRSVTSSVTTINSAAVSAVLVEDLEHTETGAVSIVGLHTARGVSAGQQKTGAEDDPLNKQLQRYIHDLDAAVTHLDQAVHLLQTDDTHSPCAPEVNQLPVTRPTELRAVKDRAFERGGERRAGGTCVEKPKLDKGGEMEKEDLNKKPRRNRDRLCLYIVGGKDLEPQCLAPKAIALWRCSVTKAQVLG